MKNLFTPQTFAACLVTALVTSALFYFMPVTYSDDETATAYEAGLTQCLATNPLTLN